MRVGEDSGPLDEQEAQMHPVLPVTPGLHALLAARAAVSGI